MKENISKMTFLFMILGIVISLVFSVSAFAGKPVGFTFEVTAQKTKIGDASGHPTYSGDYHNIVVDGTNVYVVFTNVNDYTGEHEIVFGRSRDGGLTWDRNQVVAHGSYLDTNGAAIAVGPDPLNPGGKIIHVAYGDESASGIGIYYSRSLNYGSAGSWESPKKINGARNATSYSRVISADGLGGVHIAFDANEAWGTGVYYISSSDGGVNFNTEPELIDIGSAPSIAADMYGNIFLSYTDKWYVYLKKKLVPSPLWTPAVIVNGNPTGYTDEQSIAVYDINKIYIATRYYVFRTSNGGNTPSDWIQTPITPPSAQTASIVVDGNGILSIAWGTSTGVYFSRSINSGATWTTPQLILNISGLPNIAVDI